VAGNRRLRTSPERVYTVARHVRQRDCVPFIARCQKLLPGPASRPHHRSVCPRLLSSFRWNVKIAGDVGFKTRDLIGQEDLVDACRLNNLAVRTLTLIQRLIKSGGLRRDGEENVFARKETISNEILFVERGRRFIQANGRGSVGPDGKAGIQLGGTRNGGLPFIDNLAEVIERRFAKNGIRRALGALHHGELVSTPEPDGCGAAIRFKDHIPLIIDVRQGTVPDQHRELPAAMALKLTPSKSSMEYCPDAVSL